MTRDMCFPAGGAHISRDMCFLGEEQISLGICVSQLGEHIKLGQLFNFFNFFFL